MKGFLQEYGIIMVVVAVVLGMLAFGKAGYAKSIQDAILGSADHIVETGENIAKSDKKEANVKAGDTLDIEGTKYVVLEQKENNQALVITASSIGKKVFQSTGREDGQNMSTYEGSTIDNYLENEWYNSLPSTMKAAIRTTNIKQVACDSNGNKYETGWYGQVYNVISRHVFLPSVDEIGKIVDLKNPDKVKAFLLKGENIWTRDSDKNSPWDGLFYCGQNGFMYFYDACTSEDTYPAFVIDLSKVDYTEAGHVDYK